MALTLCALGLAPGAAHVMELPIKLGYSAEQYAQVTSTLYGWFGSVGGAVQVAAVLAGATLAYRLRGTATASTAAAAAVALIVSLALWGALVAPVNAAWSGLSPTDSGFAAQYAALRNRWEYGHVAAFIAWLTGWLGLVAVVTRLCAGQGHQFVRKG